MVNVCQVSVTILCHSCFNTGLCMRCETDSNIYMMSTLDRKKCEVKICPTININKNSKSDESKNTEVTLYYYI